MRWKFAGAVAVGNKVVFAPHNADAVGVYDAGMRTFDSSASTGSLTINEKFWGAAAAGKDLGPEERELLGGGGSVQRDLRLLQEGILRRSRGEGPSHHEDETRVQLNAGPGTVHRDWFGRADGH